MSYTEETPSSIEVKRKPGRPLGSGKSDPRLCEYWREQKAKRKQRKDEA